MWHQLLREGDMADIRPFRGLRYDPSTIGEMARVVSPPYDIISPSQEKSLRQRSPYNVVLLELPQREPGDTDDDNRYTRAASLFGQWQYEGVLVPEETPAMYLVEEEFTYEGSTWRRQGLTTAVRLEEFEKGIVLPHEFTTPGPKADRLALMKACRANFSPIMSLYYDAKDTIADLLTQVQRGQPAVTVPPSDTPIGGHAGYKMWVIADSGLLTRISESMAPLQIFVADGHHRYETALQNRDELQSPEGVLPPNAAARFMMMTLFSMNSPGLLVLPYHRIVGGLADVELAALRRGLDQAFHIQPIEVPPPHGGVGEVAKAIENELESQPKGEVVVAIFGLERDKAHLLTLRQSHRSPSDAPSLERCDMWLLHQRGIRPALGEEREAAAITFVHDSAEAVQSVTGGEADLAFLLRPLPMALFEEVVGKGERLPPKSTYFYPKLPTGLVINHLVGEL